MASTGPAASTVTAGRSLTFNPGSAGANFSSADSSYLNNTHGTMGQTKATYSDFNGLFGLPDDPIYELRKNKAISNYNTTLYEVYRGFTIPLLSTVLDNVLAVNACNPILDIVSPYLRTLTQTATYEMMALNIYPAQPTLNGVSEKTNTNIKTSFSMSTRQYGINAQMPVDVASTPFENQYRKNITMLMMALSLAYTFIQVVLVFFVMHATIGGYYYNFGYNFMNGMTNMENIDATDRRYIGCGNESPAELLRAIDLHVRTLAPLPGRDGIKVLTTPEVGVYLSTQLKSEQIRDVETYIGYVQRAELEGPILAAKKQYKIPPGQQGWKLPLGGVVLLPVPTLPISVKINLPHLLRQLTSTPQYYYQPQRTKLPSSTDKDKNTMGIYDVGRDDYDFLQPSAILARCGVWNTHNGHFSDKYRATVEKMNPTKDSGMQPVEPTVLNSLPLIRDLTPTEADVIQTLGYQGSMPLTCYDGDDRLHKLATEFHAISEDTYPVSHSIRGGRDIMLKYPKDMKKVMNFLHASKAMMDTAPSDKYATGILAANTSAVAAAGETTWATGSTTYSTSKHDADTLTLPTEVEASMIGVGLAHSPDAIRQLDNVTTSARGQDKSSSLIKALDGLEDIKNNEVLIRSGLLRRSPAWDKSQSPASALISELGGGIPAFMQGPDLDPEMTRAAMKYDDFVGNLALLGGNVAAKPAFPTFKERVTLLNNLGPEARMPETFNRIDYLVVHGVSKVTPDTIRAAWASTPAVNFSYQRANVSKGDAELLQALGVIATCVAILHIEKPAEVPLDTFDRIVLQIKAQTLPSAVVLGTNTLGGIFAKDANFKFVQEIDKQSGRFMRPKYVRLSFTLSHLGWSKFKKGKWDAHKLFPGDYRTGYATPITTEAEFDKLEANISKVGPKSGGAGLFQGIFSRGRHHSETSAEAMAGTSAYNGNRYPLIHGVANPVNPAHAGIYQSKHLSTISQNRLAAILQRFSGSANDGLLAAIYLHLFMPTDLFTVGTLADNGIWVPVDWAAFRIIISDTSMALILADGCGQMMINEPHVAQKTDSISNTMVMKATIQIGVRPMNLNSMTAIRSAFMNKNLYGLNTRFIDRPDVKILDKINRDGLTTNQPCMFAMILAPTEDLGDCFSWCGESPAASTMVLSRLAEAVPCRRKPEIFTQFYQHYFSTLTRTIKGLSDKRYTTIKSYYNKESGQQMHGDGDAHLRQLADGHLIDDIWVRGPTATFERGAMRTNSGLGPFGQIHHQSKGAAPCWRGNVHYFRQTDPRAVGQVAI